MLAATASVAGATAAAAAVGCWFRGQQQRREEGASESQQQQKLPAASDESQPSPEVLEELLAEVQQGQQQRRGEEGASESQQQQKLPAASAESQPSPEVLEELLAEVSRQSKAIQYVVSDKTNKRFSIPNLTKYLRQKGIEAHAGATEEETIEVNARRLLALLKQASAGASRRLGAGVRHELLPNIVASKELEAIFPAMVDAYVQQALDYGRNSRYGDKWKISCYLVVMENWKPKLEAHEPMVRCMSPVMDQCTQAFAKWYCRLRTLPSVDVHVMNAFVTRYRPMHGEDQLEKHIDGANVDGSVILALPTDDPFEGGGLHVWDGKPQQECVYQMKPGEAIFLDHAVWHQAKPISVGTRWALVLFLRLRSAGLQGRDRGGRTEPDKQ